VTQSSSVADELTKLGELYRSAALTDDEFQAYKARLLRQGAPGAKSPSILKVTTWRAGILTLSGIVLGTLGGLIPVGVWAPRNGFGGLINRSLYAPDSPIRLADVLWDTLASTTANYALFFLLIWLIVRRVSVPLIVGLIAGVLYAGLCFLLGLPSALFLLSYSDGRFADGLIKTLLTLLWMNAATWAVVFSIVAFVMTRPNKAQPAGVEA